MASFKSTHVRGRTHTPIAAATSASIHSAPVNRISNAPTMTALRVVPGQEFDHASAADTDNHLVLDDQRRQRDRVRELDVGQRLVRDVEHVGESADRVAGHGDVLRAGRQRQLEVGCVGFHAAFRGDRSGHAGGTGGRTARPRRVLCMFLTTPQSNEPLENIPRPGRTSGRHVRPSAASAPLTHPGRRPYNFAVHLRLPAAVTGTHT